MDLLHSLCRLPAPSGNEAALARFVLAYIHEQQDTWLVQPEIIADERFQDCILLVFGQPRTAVFAHLDSIGFTVRYGRELVPIGGPVLEAGTRLVGEDRHGPIDCRLALDADTGHPVHDFHREIERGTELTFYCDFRETETTVQSCYLDNRLGVYNALRLCETLEHGAIAFSCWEEHGGGAVAYLARYLHETYGLRQALISDITWVTEGVTAGAGCVISLRDSLIPRRAYVNRIRAIAERSGLAFQLEVEGSGGSDAKELQRADAPWDWCFVGAPEDHVHSANELVNKQDIASMLALYRVLMQEL